MKSLHPAISPPRSAHDAPCEEAEDGLGVWRGMTAALVIEALAVGIVWAVWQAAPIVAAWWRAW